MAQDKLQACGRLSATSDKARTELTVLLAKWFEKNFVKGISVALAQSISTSGAGAAFETLLSGSSDEVIIGVVRKLDPNRVDILSRPRDELLAHIRSIAAGTVLPADKPKPPKKTAASKAPARARKPGGVLANARQG
jgi:hypothetical protein